MATVASFRDEYLPAAQGHPYHAKWLAANPAEKARWTAYRDSVLAGSPLPPPTMTTKYGRQLVWAARQVASTAVYPSTSRYPSEAL